MFKEQYPSVYSHLLKFKEALSQRNREETGIRYEWYALQRWGAKYWDDFSEQVIAWQRITKRPIFCLTKQKMVVLDSMAFIANAGEYSDLFLAVLNSNLIYFWAKINVHEYGDTGFRLSNQYVELIPIPYVEEVILQEIKNKISQMTLNYSPKIDAEIQGLVYSLYGISTEEQNYIENYLKN